MNKYILKFPRNIVEPIRIFLEREIVRLKRTKKRINKSDPFSDSTRIEENSLEEDVDEQIGHFDSQVKAKFMDKQIVQLNTGLPAKTY